MLLISEHDVESLLDLSELIGAMEAALKALSTGHVIQPVRMALPILGQHAWFGLMPAVYDDVIGAKLVTVFPRNAERGLATHMAAIHLFRGDTGEPLAVLDGRVITAWRTAAVSALATRELSAPDSKVLAILGSGVQARTHFRMLSRVRTFSDVRVWSRTAEHTERFANEIGARVLTAEAAVNGADVIVTATHAAEPVLRGEWLKKGAHVNAIGAVGPNARELDDEAMAGAAIVVESREAALRESAEIIQSGAAIYAEIGELLSRVRPRPNSQRTIYKSLGVAVEDVAAANMIYRKAIARRTQPEL